MPYLDFVQDLHRRTARDYIGRVTAHDKAECAALAGRFGEEYWDGPRHLGYGGYRYDGRWRPVADRMAAHYGLKAGDRVLDVGCGKGFLLYELAQAVPGLEIAGLDISGYAIAHAKEEVRPHLVQGTASDLPWPDRSFDFVVSLTALHNLFLPDLWRALGELERVAKGGRYLSVEAYRDEKEKANLLYWQLTCRAFHTPAEWEWLFAKAGYTGDFGFIYFE
ncbi:MAG: class I SAM-dependent methyltransferase [Magnetospirillum sp. WYHS-4]